MSGRSRCFLAALATSLVALAIAGCRAAPAEVTGSQSAGSRLAKPYPIESFAADALDGKRVSLADWKDHVVIVNVWATWCAPCRRELPMLQSLQTKYHDRVRVLGVLQDNVTDDFARQFVKNAGLTFPIIRSTFEIESRLPAIVVIPMTYVINPAGQLVSMFAGEADGRQVEREINDALGASRVPASR